MTNRSTTDTGDFDRDRSDDLETRWDPSSTDGDGVQAAADKVIQRGAEALDSAQTQASTLVDKATDAVGEDTIASARAKADELGTMARENAAELGSAAQDKADEGMDAAASGLSTASDKLREQAAQQDGQVGTYATMAADRLDDASGYLREKDTEQVLNDLEELIRRKPMESLLAAAGLGLLLSRLFR